MAKLAGLLRQRVDEILRQHLRKASDVEDVLLGIQCRELPASLRQSVDDPGRRASHPGVEQCEQPGGTGANDRDVDHVMLRLARPVVGRGMWRVAHARNIGDPAPTGKVIEGPRR